MVGSWTYLSKQIYPEIWYCRVQKNILSTLKNFKNTYHISVRFYNNPNIYNPNKKFAHQMGLDIKEESLPEVIEKEKFDFIITEAVATTLLEILCTRSQIISFFPKDFINISVEAKALLHKRIFFAETEKDYYDLVSKILGKNPALPLKAINDEFLMAYGLENIRSDPTLLAKQSIDEILQGGKIDSYD